MPPDPRCRACGYTLRRMLKEGLEVTGEQEISGSAHFIVHAVDEDGQLKREGLQFDAEPTLRCPTLYCGNCGNEMNPRSVYV